MIKPAWYKNPGHGSTSLSASYVNPTRGPTRLRATVFAARDRTWKYRWTFQVHFFPERGTPDLLHESIECFRTQREAKSAAYARVISIDTRAHVASAAFSILFGKAS